MDITLEGSIDGISATEMLHAEVDIPVIYITAHSDSDMFERAKKTEPYAYLIKPYDIYQLQTAMEIALFKHHLEKQLKDSENRYRTLFEISDSAMMLVGEQSVVIMVNKKFEIMTGRSKESVEGIAAWTDFFEDSERPMLSERLHKYADDTVAPLQNFETKLIDRKGNRLTVYTNIKTFPGTCAHVVSMNDISELKMAEQKIRLLNNELHTINAGLHKEISFREKIEKQLRYKATHDHLTGLPNRILLFDRIKQAFAFEKRHNTLISLMILDLDNFKTINDSMGHLSGDILLKKVASGLQNCVRQYDTVGRLGGDEFVLIVNDAYTVQDIIAFAEKVQSVFHEAFDILGQQIYVTASIGVAVYPLHGTTFETLLRKADFAMYVAKKAGRNTFRFYSDSMNVPDSTLKNMRTKRRISQMEQSTHNYFHINTTPFKVKDQLSH
jgi:diguanylate cyclase (GGDEF)-like protein/PAS domain S-box-containing protein